MTTQNFKIQWQGINIAISYNDNYSNAYREIYGYGIAHLEIQSEGKEHLPITSTGYYSLFRPAPEFEEYDDILTFVLDWLNDAAKSREWKEYLSAKRQLSLF